MAAFARRSPRCAVTCCAALSQRLALSSASREIIAIAAADAGATQTIKDQVAKLGVNRLSLGCDQSSNSGRRGPVVTLIDDDAKFVKDGFRRSRCSTLNSTGSATIVAGDAAWTTEVWGTSASYALTHDMKMKEGRF